MLEYYRQFAFVSSLLAGFAFAFYGTLLGVATPHRTASWAAFLSVAASISFLLVTLGMTFAANFVSNLRSSSPMPAAVAAQQTPLSTLFLVGVLLLLASFGLGGWVRSRQLGISTTIIAALGGIVQSRQLMHQLER